MKLFDFAIIIALSSAFIRQPTDGAEFYFKEPRVRFPDTKEGIVLTHSFSFTNVGDAPLIISEYKVACSCTQVDFPKEPIAPGGTGTIQLKFNSEGKYGLQVRKIELYSNTSEKPYELSFKVYIIPKE
jgi:hypothetical protein